MIIAREIISPSSWYSGKVEQQYKYYVIDNDNNLLFEYAAINISSYEKLSERMKPSAFYKLKDGALKTQTYSTIIQKYSRGTHKGTISAMTGTLEENKLEIYVPYTHKEIIFETVFDECITDEIKAKITKLEMPYPIVIIGEDLSKETEKKCENGAIFEERFCTKCKKVYSPKQPSDGFYNLDFHCPECHNRATHTDIIMQEFKDYRKSHLGNGYGFKYESTPSVKKNKFYYMFSVENGIILYAIAREIIAKKNKIVEKYSVEYSIEHIIGKNIATYKHLKKGKKECDAFEALNINTKNIMSPPHILYEDSESFFDFASKNEKFLKMSGFQDVMKYSPIQLEMEPFFISFIAIMNKYPILEQLVKMGHARLFFTLYEKMLSSNNKAEIDANVKKLGKLIDCETTKGKNALRFPPYISEFLIKKNSELDEYYYWADLYEMTKMDKSQFEKITDSLSFAWINSQAKLADICNILKFDYSLEKLFSYIIKQAKQNKNMSIPRVINYLTDYLNMCDICGIEADKYPQDIEKQHDNMNSYFMTRKQAQYDSLLTTIGNDCEKYVVPKEDELDNIGIPKMFSKMTVVFPKNEADFINEGNQQHNCVGSYPRAVREGRCIIFFIRYKDSPEKSFITAECTRNGLGQCFYSNNRRVEDEELMKFAKYVANKIKAGCNSGRIKGLTNIPL